VVAEELTAHPTKCTLAYWHKPPFSSGAAHGNDSEVEPLWRDLYAANADVVSTSCPTLTDHAAAWNLMFVRAGLRRRAFPAGRGQLPYACRSSETASAGARSLVRDIVVNSCERCPRGFKGPATDKFAHEISVYTQVLPHYCWGLKFWRGCDPRTVEGHGSEAIRGYEGSQTFRLYFTFGLVQRSGQVFGRDVLASRRQRNWEECRDLLCRLSAWTRLTFFNWSELQH
jgi:hypothetical protein